METPDESKWQFHGVRVVRGGQDPVVVNLDIPVVDTPSEVHWVDNIHPDPTAV
jgi:hypothetical protein